MGVAFVRQASPGATRFWKRVGVVEMPRPKPVYFGNDTEGPMTKGMIKRGSGSAYTKLIRRRRAKQIRAEDSAPVEPIIIKSHLRRLERKR
jgi:hypothetical protein